MDTLISLALLCVLLLREVQHGRSQEALINKALDTRSSYQPYVFRPQEPMRVQAPFDPMLSSFYTPPEEEHELALMTDEDEYEIFRTGGKRL